MAHIVEKQPHSPLVGQATKSGIAFEKQTVQQQRLLDETSEASFSVPLMALLISVILRRETQQRDVNWEPQEKWPFHRSLYMV